MRLADEIYASAGSQSDIGGSITSLKMALLKAQRFELEDDFALACDNLANIRPSSLLATLPLCRLPYNSVWIEWRSRARQLLDKGDDLEPTKLGCLLERSDSTAQQVTATWAWFHDQPEVRGVSICPMGVSFDWSAERSIGPKPFHLDQTNDIMQTMQTLQKLHPYRTSPREIEAFTEIAKLTTGVIPRHCVDMVEALFDGKTPTERKRLITMWRNDISGEAAFVQCAIALLNSRNCVESEPVDLSKLNRAREKRGKPQLASYAITRLVLSKSQQRTSDSKGLERREARQHLVRGHLKTRKGGIYWWSSFVRGNPDVATPRQAYDVTL